MKILRIMQGYDSNVTHCNKSYIIITITNKI